MAGDRVITVRCACGKKLHAPIAAVGRTAGCPACGGKVLLSLDSDIKSPAAASATPVAQGTAARGATPQAAAPAVAARAAAYASTPAASAPKGTAVSLDDLDSIGDSYDVDEEAQSAQPARMTFCPGCRSKMDEGAILCVKCGFDTRTGKAIAAPAAAKPKPYAGPNGGRPQIDMMAPQGSFYKGLLMSAIFAAVSSLLWIGFAWATGFELRFIAFIIGGCAGAGMKVGQDGFSGKGGTAAAGMAVLAILFAKFAVLELYMASLHIDRSFFDLNAAGLAIYFFNPWSAIFMIVGIVAAFRTANGSFSA